MSSNNRKTGNLVALGSAAVVAVYGAGFMRTAAAAERFARQSNERVLSPAEAEVIAALANDTAKALAAPSALAPSARTSAPATSPATKVDATTAEVSTKAIAGGTAVTSAAQPPASAPIATAQNAPTDSAARNAAAAIAAVTTPPANTATVNSAAPAAAQSATSAPATSVAAAPVNAPPAAPNNAAPTSPAAPAASTPTSVAQPAVKVEEPATAPAESKPALKWKDGDFTGYGTSRHGDIEVYLETNAGKISYIKISQCLTQYSCSWINHLPGQVIARQGPNVDGVSGATQSVNAFYYAVVQALSKAK